jgi:hypothetical protein
MNYRIRRGDQEFGPYSLAELKQYLAEGRIVPADLARSEGMEEWTPVSQVLGDASLGQSVAAMAVPSGSDSPGGEAAAGLPAVPPPPALHWALVLLLNLVTCSLFMMVWMFIQANWTKKVDPENKSMWLFAVYIGSVFAAVALGFASGATGNESLDALGGLFNLGGSICAIVGFFMIKSSLETYFAGPPMHLQLSGVLTFFFNIFYIQYHFTRISGAYGGTIQAR